MAKLRLLLAVVATVGFLLSLWVIPLALVGVGLFITQTVWIKVSLFVTALLWLLMLHPWTMFRNPKFPRFLADMRRAFRAIFLE
ncbi:hypothetical protein [uncultured Duncaniella sp.]|uniref:hypothetical protein n=1 Tax=uncultured Duncaniella sp. TaxID=2768039 RepID=UPI002608BBED|nr:hypothetical protein [uncultured Duncaniella sp.]